MMLRNLPVALTLGIALTIPRSAVAGDGHEEYRNESIYVAKRTATVSGAWQFPEDISALRDRAREAGGEQLALTFTVPPKTTSEEIADMARMLLDQKVERKRYDCAVAHAAFQVLGLGTVEVRASAVVFAKQEQCDALAAAGATPAAPVQGPPTPATAAE